MIHTPLSVGDILPISLMAGRRARGMFPNHLMKFLGHQAQFTHDAEYTAAGWDMVFQESTLELYDRTEPTKKFLYDDKVCTFYDQFGMLKTFISTSHSISNDEYIRWNRHLREVDGGDVIIMSFDYTDQSHTSIIFQGALSWRAMRGFVREQKSAYTISLPSSRKHNQA